MPAFIMGQLRIMDFEQLIETVLKFTATGFCKTLGDDEYDNRRLNFINLRLVL